LVRLAEAASPGWRRSSSGRYDHLGAPFALLLAEQPFVPGYRVSVTMTSAGTIALAAPSCAYIAKGEAEGSAVSLAVIATAAGG
jgi:hypothetical protein